MWDERLNEYLDDPSKVPERDVREQYVRYRYVIGVFAAKVSYRPSEDMKKEFLKKIRRKNRTRRFLRYALVMGSIAIASFVVFANLSREAPTVQMNDLVDSIQIVRTVGDGF